MLRTTVTSSTYAYALFDSAETHSFISASFVDRHKMMPEMMDAALSMGTLVRGMLVIDHVCTSCVVEIEGKKWEVDFVVLDMEDFDVILRLDRLAANHVHLDHHGKVVRFYTPRQPDISLMGSSMHSLPHAISALKASQLLRKGCQGYLASVVDSGKESLDFMLLMCLLLSCRFYVHFPKSQGSLDQGDLDLAMEYQ
ncbi:uncharacterized protein LOC143883085 [Tasmannia lanceolata]|uniref:uncharacterized protein LOC143883085 n=1 Tax=Tasmannia lanceolata TaxID=3420 RepID=UPI004064310E